MSKLVLGAAPKPLVNAHTILGVDLRPLDVVSDGNVIGVVMAGEEGGYFLECYDVAGAPGSSYLIYPDATYYMHGGTITFRAN